MAIKDLEFEDDFELIDENSELEDEVQKSKDNVSVETDEPTEDENKQVGQANKSSANIENDEFNPLKENFDFLKEQGLLVLPDNYEYDGTEESFQKVIEDSKKEMFNLVTSEIYDKLPDEVRNVVKYLLEGGEDPNAYISYSNDPFKDIDISSEENRKEILKTYWKQKGLTDAKADKIVSKSFDLGTDEEDANEALEELKSIFKQNKEQLEQQAKQRKQEEELREKEAIQNLYKILNESKEIEGIEISDIDKKAFKDFTQTRYKDNKTGQIFTKFDKKLEEHLTDPSKFILLSKFLQDGFNVKIKTTQKTEKEKTKSFYQKLKENSSKSDGRSNSKNGFTSNKNKYSITDGNIEFELDI